MALTTLARVQMLPSLVGADAAYLALLLEAASELIERYCKRAFASTVYTDELYDGDGTSVLMLRQFPIITLTNVKTIDPDDTESICLGAEFHTNLLTGEIQLAPDCECNYCYFPNGFRNIKVTYTAGFATVPEAVQEACAKTVAWLYADSEIGANVAGWKLGDAAATYMKHGADVPMLPLVIRMLLATYRNIRP